MPRRDITARYKVVLAPAQSNERGHRWLVDESAGSPTTVSRGITQQDPIQPNGDTGTGTTAQLSTQGSWWPKCFEAVYDSTGIMTDLSNTAIGGSSVVQHWCCDDSNTGTANDGNGTGTPYDMNDGVQWDKNGYFAAALAEAQKGAFDGRYVIMSLGQTDSSKNITLINYQAGLQNAIDYFEANNITVILGFTCFQTGDATWYSTIGTVAIANLLAANPSVLAGANLYDLWGERLPLMADGAHLTELGYDRAGVSWADALIAIWS